MQLLPLRKHEQLKECACCLPLRESGQAATFERAKAEGVRRTGGRGRRRLLGEILEDAEEDQKRFERWKVSAFLCSEGIRVFWPVTVSPYLFQNEI